MSRLRLLLSLLAPMTWLRLVWRSLEPPRIPDKAPEDILRAAGWEEPLIESTRGRWVCLGLAFGKVKREMWEALRPPPPGRAAFWWQFLRLYGYRGPELWVTWVLAMTGRKTYLHPWRERRRLRRERHRGAMATAELALNAPWRTPETGPKKT